MVSFRRTMRQSRPGKRRPPVDYYRRIELIDECFEGCEVCDVDFEDAGRIRSCETGAGGYISETVLRTFYHSSRIVRIRGVLPCRGDLISTQSKMENT
jgi:hypothetical protein